MVKLLFKILIPVVTLILVYNYFFGSSKEKETSQKVFTQVKDLSVSVFDLLKQEKEKFDGGKYDEALAKVNKIYATLKAKGEDLSETEKEQLEDLKVEKDKLSSEISQAKQMPEEQADKATKRLDQRILDFIRKAEDINEKSKQ